MNKIAIIGAGPAGIIAAVTLSKLNYQVWLFEKEAFTNINLRNKMFLFPDFSEAKNLIEKLDEELKLSFVKLMPEKEIVHIEQQGKKWKLFDQNKQEYEADAVLLTTGYEVFDAKRKEELGYGIYKGVITSMDLEQMFKDGKIVNSIGETPKKVVFLQCVGSRDEKSGNNYCSKICCITAVKQAIEIRKFLPETEVNIFYMDLRMWGQSYEELYREAQEKYNIYFVRGRISEAAATFDSKIQIKSEDTLLGVPLKMTTDLLVLMVGMEPAAGTKKLSQKCQISGEYGFAQSQNQHLNDNRTTQEGLFVAGSCKRPVNITDAIADARSAAMNIHDYLKN